MRKDAHLEDDFHRWAFGILYKMLETDNEPYLRFTKAIVRSARPVPVETMRRWDAVRGELSKLADMLDFQLARGVIDRAQWNEAVEQKITELFHPEPVADEEGEPCLA